MITKEEFVEQTYKNILSQKKKPSFQEWFLLKFFKKGKKRNGLYSDLAFALAPLWIFPLIILPVLLCIYLNANDFFSVMIFIMVPLVICFPFYKGIFERIIVINDSLNPKDVFLEQILKKWGICYAKKCSMYDGFKGISDALKDGNRRVLKINGISPFYFQQKLSFGLEDNDPDAAIVQFYWKTNDYFNGEVFYSGEDPVKDGTELTLQHPLLCKPYDFIAPNEKFANWKGLEDSLDRAKQIADAFNITYEDCIFYQKKDEVFFDVKMTLNEAFWDLVWAYNKDMQLKKGLSELYNQLEILCNLANEKTNADGSRGKGK